MKILLVTKKFPYPLKEGEPIAISYLARSLVALGCEVDILVMNTSKHYFDPKDFPAHENFYTEIHSVQVDNHIRLGGALRSLLAGRAYIIDRFQSAEFAQKLEDLLHCKRYDVVQLETIYLAHYLPILRRHRNLVVSLRAHNVEHEIWERVASSTQNPFKKWYLKNQNRHLKRFELEYFNQFDVLLAITSRDLEVFRAVGYRHTAVTVPVGINLTEYPIDNQEVVTSQNFCFIGALDWMPNQLGVVWFLDNVWDKMALDFPKCKFLIAGKNTPAWLKARKDVGVEVLGEVNDAKAFIKQQPILVAPLFAGSGIKVKVLEGMALGRAVITTSIGAEGIPAVPGKHFLLADNAESFAKQLKFCFENPAKVREIGESARQFIQENFDNLEIASRVVAVYAKFVNC